MTYNDHISFVSLGFLHVKSSPSCGPLQARGIDAEEGDLPTLDEDVGEEK